MKYLLILALFLLPACESFKKLSEGNSGHGVRQLNLPPTPEGTTQTISGEFNEDGRTDVITPTGFNNVVYFWDEDVDEWVLAHQIRSWGGPRPQPSYTVRSDNKFIFSRSEQYVEYCIFLVTK